MKLPTFFILGAARCGTTSLAHYIGQHPDVVISSPKEPKFFEAEYEAGPAYYWETYFAHWRGQRAAGDARGANLYLPYVAPRIRDLVPDARLIAILREPGQRALSHWWWKTTHDQERLPFADALAENLRLLEQGRSFAGTEGERLWRSRIDPRRDHVDHRIYLDGGYYDEHLQRLLALFPAEQIKVVLLDDLRREPLAITRELWKFIGVSPLPTLREERVRNAALTPAGSLLRRFGYALGARSLVPPRLRRAVVTAFSRPNSRPAVDPDVRRWLSDHFCTHVDATERLLGRDLAAWRLSGERGDGSVRK